MKYNVLSVKKRSTSLIAIIIIILCIVIFATLDLSFDSSHVVTSTLHQTTQPKVNGGGSIFLVAIMRSLYPDQTALVNLYGPYLTSHDYLFTKPNTRNLEYALQLPGLKGVEYFSLAQIQANAGSLRANGLNFISYDIETQYSPANELSNPVAAVRNASNIVHNNNLKFMLTTTHKMDLQYASQFAPLVDIYNPQGQALQPDPARYLSFYKNITTQIRAANPTVKIIAQVSTIKGSVQNMEQAFSLVAPYVDGVTFWYGTTPDQLVLGKQFLDWLRPRY